MNETRESLIEALIPLAEAVAEQDFADPLTPRVIDAMFPFVAPRMAQLKERLCARTRRDFG